MNTIQRAMLVLTILALSTRSLNAFGQVQDGSDSTALAVQRYRDALKTTYSPDRFRAIEALGKFGPAAVEAVPDLLTALQAKEDFVRWAAVKALGQISPHAEEVVRALTAALKDPADWVREGAALALRTKCAVPALAKALQDPSSSVREAAAVTLRRLGPDAREAIEALRRAAKKSDGSGREAARALEEVAPSPPRDWPLALDLNARGPGSVSADGRRIAAESAVDGVCVWDTVTGQRLSFLKETKGFGYCRSLAMSPHGHLVAGNSECKVVVWEAVTGDILFTLDGYTQRGRGAECLTFSPDDRLLAVADNEDRVVLWDVGRAKEVRSLVPWESIGRREYPPKGWGGGPWPNLSGPNPPAYNPIRCLAFSRDGKLLAAGFHGAVVVWNVTNGELLFNFFFLKPYGVAFSPDGQRLAVASLYGTISQLDLKTGKGTRDFSCKEGNLTALAFSPDGKLLLTGWRSLHAHGQAAMILLDAETGVRRHVFRGFGSEVSSVAFSGDGRRVFGSGDRARAWDLARVVPDRTDGKTLVEFTVAMRDPVTEQPAQPSDSATHTNLESAPEVPELSLEQFRRLQRRMPRSAVEAIMGPPTKSWVDQDLPEQVAEWKGKDCRAEMRFDATMEHLAASGTFFQNDGGEVALRENPTVPPPPKASPTSQGESPSLFRSVCEKALALLLFVLICGCGHVVFARFLQKRHLHLKRK